MSNYVKNTNYTVKDGYTTGDSRKTVKGTELDGEFNDIADAIASKADTASPTFTGTPAGPTATAGSSTTQLATTAFVRSARPVQGTYTMLTSSTTATCPASITVPLIIAVNGVIQEQGASGGYTISSTTLTFAEALPIGSVIFALGYTS